MDDPGTDSLRKLAPSWTLAGDEQLLSILQNTHQRLLSKCQEANSQLEQMATALNDASISLQNVNNQFMALSNSQFIESRVYDDDDLATDVPTVKQEPPKPVVTDELTSLKHSISVLENAHEVITILQDSDTESDTDDDMPARIVLKPKDVYAHRPLPYIIGSQPWKNKWHAGLLLEDSDSDSLASKEEHDSEQYSQSEPDDTHTDKLPVPDTHTTVSETSSELPSEQGFVPKPSPSDVASELARRLGAREPPKMVEREPEYEEPVKPTVRKIYRPQDPVSSTIFPDEPPPLSDHSDSQESDIFADLHRSQPYARSQLTDDLFGFNENEDYERDSDEGDIISDFAKKPVTNPSAKPTSLFDAGPTPHMFDKRHTPDDRRARDDHRRPDDRARNVYDRQAGTDERGTGDVGAEVDRGGVKKPVGGISLFGNKGTESIGAAILKRNQRKSSTSDDESESDSRSESQSNQQIRKEKDIFDDLFARSEGKNVAKDKGDVVKDIIREIPKKKEEIDKDKKIEKAKVDLFSDNLFDDIDDIFSTNVVKMPTKDNNKTKSIFEDDDELFSDIAASKPMKIEVASSINNKTSLFDSDDELFSENIPQSKPDDKPKAIPTAAEVSKPNVAERPKSSETKINKVVTSSIFDDDEDELFSDVKSNKHNEMTKVQNTQISVEISNDLSEGVEHTSKNIVPPKSSNVFKSPSLFDDDDDESDLFAEPAKSLNVQNVTTSHSKDFEKKSTKNEVIPEKMPDKTVDFISSSKGKTDDVEQNAVKNENINLNTGSSHSIESNVNKIVDNTSEPLKSSEDSNTPVLPVIENVDSQNLNTNVKTRASKIFDHIQKNIQSIESSSDNDFSDQDFDDLPPKEETNSRNLIINSNLAAETNSNEIPKGIHNIFDKTVLEDDIDKIFAKPEQDADNSDTIFKDIEPDFTETILKDSKKTEHDNKTDQIATKTIEADIFSDILTEPPVFEKPKEPKKSKNVNALFDDDSDDESLFFRKNDPIFEENPKDFTPTQDRLFGLFTDEPPDDGFGKISDDLDDDMFCTIPKPRVPQNENLSPIPDVVDLEPTDNKILEIEKVDPVEDIFKELQTEKTPVPEIPKVPSLYKQNDSEEIFKNPDKVKALQIEQQKSPPTLLDTEQLFKKPENETKSPLQNKPSPDILSDDETLFASVPKLEKPHSFPQTKDDIPVPVNTNLESGSKSPDEELFTSLSKKEIPPLPDIKTVKQNMNLKSDEDLFKIPKNKPEFIPKSAEIPSADLKPEKSEPKKVGKLKMGLNINVNALLPGASPKKVKPNDQTDGQTQNVIENKKLEQKTVPEVKTLDPIIPESQNTDSKLLKSVSFDGKPESDILDNKLSKERAKIQVKRRPSTRRARREAVRKSGIDFGEDSTDNSSSIDDPPRIPSRKQPDIGNTINTEARESNEDRQNTQDESISKHSLKTGDPIIQAETQPKILENNVTSKPTSVERHTDVPDKATYPKDVKSKIVYILNDEDIFNTSPAEKPESMNKNVTSLKSENLDSNVGVTTLGKVYDKTAAKNDSKSLFGDEDDEEIFKAKTAVKKTNIFDSDSEEELFGTSKKEVNKKEHKIEVKKEKGVIKREVVKGSLFGDDEDDDDLFSVKTKKVVEQKPQPSRSTAKETPKPTEPVFEDPLSMFGDDD